MAQSLFNFNTYQITLSSPPPLSSSVFSLSAFINGVTRVYVNYNLLNFTIKPFKVIVDWPYQKPYALNDVYVYNAEIDALSTYSPTNSALSYTVITPTSVDPVKTDSTITIYYENGIIHTFSIIFVINSDNVIDMDLNVLDIQNTDQAFGTIYNFQSNRDNVVYNSVDNIL